MGLFKKKEKKKTCLLSSYLDIDRESSPRSYSKGACISHTTYHTIYHSTDSAVTIRMTALRQEAMSPLFAASLTVEDVVTQQSVKATTDVCVCVCGGGGEEALLNQRPLIITLILQSLCHAK